MDTVQPDTLSGPGFSEGKTHNAMKSKEYENMARKRMLSFDMVRVVAMAMVVMIHVSAYMVTYFHGTDNAAFIVGNIFNALGRAGTPMFMMLTGALLLDERRETASRAFYRKNLLSIVLLLLFWLLFYAVWRAVLIPLMQGGPIDMEVFVDNLLLRKGRGLHLWYLYMLVGAYVVIPVLRLFVKKENREYILGLIVLSAIVQFGTQTAGVLTQGMRFTVSDFVGKFHMEYATGYVPYLLIGWYLTAFPPTGKARIALILSGLAALIWIILSVHFFVGDIPKIRDYMAEMNTLPAMLYGAGLFTWITTRCGERENRSRVLSALSQQSFGIYVLHLFLLEILIGAVLPYKAFNERLPLVYTLVQFFLIFGLSFLLSLGLSKIKGVRKLVRG